LQATAEAAFLLSWAVAGLDDHARAHSLLERSRKLYEELDDRVQLAFVVLVRGEMACQEGDLVLARQLHEQSVALHRNLKDQYMLPTALANLAKVLIHFGKFDRAWELTRECWSIGHEVSYIREMVIMIAAFLHHAQGRHDRAARLLSYETAQRAPFGLHIDVGDRPDYDRNLTELRTQLGESAFEAAWAEGKLLTREQAIKMALRDEADR
jgi:ATP/maltotriose-dependent transcriptional regulator MalT